LPRAPSLRPQATAHAQCNQSKSPITIQQQEWRQQLEAVEKYCRPSDTDKSSKVAEEKTANGTIEIDKVAFEESSNQSDAYLNIIVWKKVGHPVSFEVEKGITASF
jgi:hypothetical protein